MKTKVIIFDFDGTLNKPNELPNSWARIWDKIGCADEDEALYKQYVAKEIDYKEWAKKVIGVYAREKVSDQMLKDISKETELVDNLKNFFDKLVNKGITLYILSGGIKNIIENCLGDLKKYIKVIVANELILKDGIVDDIAFNGFEIEDKSLFINELMKEEKLSHDEIVFVGNGENDEAVYKTKVKTICINPFDAHYSDNRLWNHVLLNCTDINEVLRFVD